MREKMWFYVYRFANGRYVFERTCGTEDAARDRIQKLGPGAVYLVNHLIAKAFY